MAFVSGGSLGLVSAERTCTLGRSFVRLLFPAVRIEEETTLMPLLPWVDPRCIGWTFSRRFVQMEDFLGGNGWICFVLAYLALS